MVEELEEIPEQLDAVQQFQKAVPSKISHVETVGLWRRDLEPGHPEVEGVRIRHRELSIPVHVAAHELVGVERRDGEEEDNGRNDGLSGIVRLSHLGLRLVSYFVRQRHPIESS